MMYWLKHLEQNLGNTEDKTTLFQLSQGDGKENIVVLHQAVRTAVNIQTALCFLRLPFSIINIYILSLSNFI